MYAEMLARLTHIDETAIQPALRILPAQMNSPQALTMMLAIGLQESRFVHRRQIGGPARGYWQFEEGTKSSRGGVWGIYLHGASRFWLKDLCDKTGVAFEPKVIYNALEANDVLAAGCARLLLFTDTKKLPDIDDAAGAWNCYAERTWRPGKPHRGTWDAFHAIAREYATGMTG